jgi:hypothetical protein
MSAVIKETKDHFMSDIYWHRAIVWLSDNVSVLEDDLKVDNFKKAWGRDWYATKDFQQGKWILRYFIENDILAVQFKLIHG